MVGLTKERDPLMLLWIANLGFSASPVDAPAAPTRRHRIVNNPEPIYHKK